MVQQQYTVLFLTLERSQLIGRCSVPSSSSGTMVWYCSSLSNTLFSCLPATSDKKTPISVAEDTRDTICSAAKLSSVCVCVCNGGKHLE